MEISLNTRLTIAFIAGLIGLAWQGAILTLGGSPSDALVTAFSGLILSTLGLGVGKNGSSGSNRENQNNPDEPSESENETKDIRR